LLGDFFNRALFNKTFFKKFNKFISEYLGHSDCHDADFLFEVYDFKEGILDFYFMDDIFHIRIYLKEVFKEKGIDRYKGFFLYPNSIKEYCIQKNKTIPIWRVKEKIKLKKVISLINQYEV
jgi:hypothetical protein